MIFLISQLALLLLLAGALGFVAGWLLNGRRLGAMLVDLRERHRQQVQRLELDLVRRGDDEFAVDNDREPLEPSEDPQSFLSGFGHQDAPRDSAADEPQKNESEVLVKPHTRQAASTERAAAVDPSRRVTLSGAAKPVANEVTATDDAYGRSTAPSGELGREPSRQLGASAAPGAEQWADRLQTCEDDIIELRDKLKTLQRLCGQGGDSGAAKATEQPARTVPHDVQPYGLAAPIGQPDDLKRIWGVGPRLETMLHNLGIFHFRQIAAFTPQDIESVAARLEQFADRVKRDNWVEQASQLLAEGD